MSVLGLENSEFKNSGFDSVKEDSEESCPAWVLPINKDYEVSIGKEELRHLVTDPVLHFLPLSSTYCQHLIEWEDRLLPLFDLAGWMQSDNNEQNARDKDSIITDKIYAIVGYNISKSRVEYGALAIIKPPVLIDVNDSDFSELDEELISKISVISSNFKYRKKFIPIIDIKKIFSGDPG